MRRTCSQLTTLLVGLCALGATGCSVLSVPVYPLFSATTDDGDRYLEAYELAKDIVAEYGDNPPVIGHQLLERNDEFIQDFISRLQTHPSMTVGAFNLGVSEYFPCIVRSIDRVVFQDRDSRELVAVGSCAMNGGMRPFSARLSTETDYVALGYGHVDFGDAYQVLSLGNTRYVLALELDLLYHDRELLRTCIGRGGILRGAIGAQYCEIDYSDAEDECADSSDCEGVCMAVLGTVGTRRVCRP